MEPLILEGAETRRPVFAAYTKGGRRLHVGLQEMGACPLLWDSHTPLACFTGSASPFLPCLRAR